MDFNIKNFSKAKYVSYMAMLLTLIVVLSIVESMLVGLMALPPFVRLGLANIVTMFALFFIGKKEALELSVIKSIFVLMTRGFTAGILSFFGGLISIIVIILLSAVFKDRISYLLLSIAGAVFHNLGQLSVATVILNTYTLYYAIVLIPMGVVMGCITGILLKTLLPVLSYPFKLQHKR